MDLARSPRGGSAQCGTAGSGWGALGGDDRLHQQRMTLFENGDLRGFNH